MLEEQFVFKNTAFKHGIVEADIRHAFEQRLFDHALIGEEYKNLLIGLDRNGNPLEIMYNVIEGEIINVFHAMKCRNAYKKFIN
ncbi:hypothetical protein [Treponema sp. R80B11-R83G3]